VQSQSLWLQKQQEQATGEQTTVQGHGARKRVPESIHGDFLEKDGPLVVFGFLFQQLVVFRGRPSHFCHPLIVLGPAVRLEAHLPDPVVVATRDKIDGSRHCQGPSGIGSDMWRGRHEERGDSSAEQLEERDL